MPADLPLEEPERRLTVPAVRPAPAVPAAGGPRGGHVWERSFLPWDAYFAVVWVGTVLFALAAESPGIRVRVAAACLFCLPVFWYVWVGRPLLVMQSQTTGTPAAVRYLAGLVLLFLPPAALVGETRLATFALVPQCFMLLRVPGALTAVAVINTAPVAAWALVWRPDTHDLYYNSVFAVVTLAFSAVVGSWIIRVIEQSTERAELVAELDASRGEIARLSAEHGALAERERLSREIHDTLAQGFTSILMLVQAVETELAADPALARRHLALMAGTARENLAEARALVAGTAPAGLDGGSLPDAVRRLAARHSEQTGAPATVAITGAVRALPAAVEVVALRSCQEALANSRRHAGPAVPVALDLDYAEDTLRVAVRDTGRGFDPAGPPGGGYGLPGLRARAAEMGGTAAVDSAPGRGTSITVTLPLAAAARSTP
ncbi:sensor histidine kinase [Actinacidiphila bryophytorum]|uniref:Oxygen sensor histidine kinase NreB n=1 Tax=Actinacidiphila bryophytorum TaxID=1436133 RepID=A0A9W4H485_9ACTN|nr:sensor histidine kinase [Actinacidiphila bryophytorum]MBM9435723.1 sensor histidine kinase [Actinacidiphila bryophytorum]MBN6543901.1 sensor histidine kinase [Actinacidiphila bryophytorum]CAG7650528.1 Nitrogen regulation protein B [Actinacidiphila bryophytorum]